MWWSRRLLTNRLPERAGGRVQFGVAAVLTILRFSSLGHLARIALNSEVSCSSCSRLTVLSTYQNQSFPSFDRGICKAHSENYTFIRSRCMIQGRWPHKVSHRSSTDYRLLTVLTFDLAQCWLHDPNTWKNFTSTELYISNSYQNFPTQFTFGPQHSIYTCNYIFKYILPNICMMHVFLATASVSHTYSAKIICSVETIHTCFKKLFEMSIFHENDDRLLLTHPCISNQCVWTHILLK
jgi:hypothetical protein